MFSRKEVFLKFYQGVFRGHFSNSSFPPNIFPLQKILFRDLNWVQNCEKFLLRGVFSQKGKSRLGYSLKTSDHACVQHQYLSDPFGPPMQVSYITQYGCGCCKLKHLEVILRVLCSYCMCCSSCLCSVKVPSQYPQRYSNLQQLHQYYAT